MIPRVQKIVGPGNAYVTAAKKLVAFDCAIDFLAGPTEALIVSDSGKPDFIAADLVAQAEHDIDALALFITSSRKLAQEVSLAVKRIANGNSTAEASLKKHAAIFVAKSRAQAREWANRLAPEHITADKRMQPSLKRRLDIRGRLFRAGGRRLRFWSKPCSSHVRAGEISRRSQRSGFRKNHFRAEGISTWTADYCAGN